MKVIAVVLLALVAVGNSLPSEQHQVEVVRDSRNIISDLIAGAIENVAQSLRDDGYDPFVHDGLNLGLGLPVPILFDTNAHVDNIVATGVSNIVINDLHYAIFSSRLTLDISLPEIALSIDDAGFDLTILGHRFNARGLGRLAISGIRIAGQVQLSISLLGQTTVRQSSLEFDLGGLQFNGYVNVMGINLTNDVNNVVSYEIPRILAELRAEVNELVNIIAKDLIEDILN
uniref:Lipid-binding serum glycoprotein N-terminal domain-containing protein n=1 Tax=Pectinophora gossypiella TaxID=13191 RepID=A0A1E1W346_PECGO